MKCFATADTIESAKKEAKQMLLELIGLSRVNPKWTIEDYCEKILRIMDNRDFPECVELSPEVQNAWSSTAYGILWTIKTARVWRVVEKDKGLKAVNTILDVFVRRLTGNDIGHFIDGREFVYQGKYRGWVSVYNRSGKKTESQDLSEQREKLTSIYDSLTPEQQAEIDSKFENGWDDWDDFECNDSFVDVSSPTDSSVTGVESNSLVIDSSKIEPPFSIYDFLSEDEKANIDAQWEATRAKIEDAR